MTDSADSAQPAFSRLSTARVSTDRPSRYGKQLAAHMGRKITSSWDETAQTGSLTFDREGAATGVVRLSCHDGVLQLDLASDGEHLERLEQVTGIHLGTRIVGQGANYWGILGIVAVLTTGLLLMLRVGDPVSDEEPAA